ncbi:MAG: cupredoxin domain-containing protein [Calditrichota bacterium]
MIENPWILLIEVAAVMGLLIFLFFRKKRKDSDQTGASNRFDLRLSGGELTPKEVVLQVNQPVQLVIARYDSEPREELFEIQELEIYELLPALNATIIKINPTQRGTFPMVIGAEKTVGTMIVQ